MLDVSQIKEITNKAIKEYIDVFGLQGWRLELVYAIPKDENPSLVYAQTTLSHERQRATIVINPTAFETEEELHETIRHELYHLVVSPFEILFHALPNEHRVLLEIVEEAIVRGIERMYGGLMDKEGSECQSPLCKQSKPE